MSTFQLPQFYPVLDSELLARRGMCPIEAAEAILEGGARILQFRHKAFFSRDVFEQATRMAELCRGAKALFVVNDRVDIAMLLDAGSHLGQDDLAPTSARAIMPKGSIIGFSTHNEQQLRAANREPVDYLAIGPIFPTASKQNPDPVIGVDQLRHLAVLAEKPLVAIGGITLAEAPRVLQAGGGSVAIIGGLYPEPLTKAVLRSRVEEWLRVCRSSS